MTNGLLKSINTKDRLYKKLIRTDIEDPQYLTLKNEFTKYALSKHYMRTFALYKNDVKQTWYVIKDTLQRKLHSSTPRKFILNNNTITDLDKIATEFDKYFITIGRSQSDQFQSTHSSLDYLLKQHKPTAIFAFKPMNEECIANYIRKLKNKSSYGYDNISNKPIKSAGHILVKPLTVIVNQLELALSFPTKIIPG